MKHIVLILALFLGTGIAFCQEAEMDTTFLKKKKVYKAFGNTWYYYKYDDGHFSIQVEDDPKLEEYQVYRAKKFQSEIGVDLGKNIWSPTDIAPSVKPWGSWNVGLNLVGINKFSKNFHLKSGIGVSWYNFKLEERNLIALKTPDGVQFDEFTEGTGTKSKISASFANLTVVPTIRSNNGKLRLGVGGYAGLRIGGRGKFVYDDAAGNSQKIFEKSNMFVNNFRYGGRVELGIGDIDLFFNYDLNELFEPGMGPKVNAISFGLIFI